MLFRTFFTLLFASLLLSGCASDEDPSALVNEADEMLINGGIEVAEKRELAAQNYDRAIRIICGEGGSGCQGSGNAASRGTEAYNLSHSHFGLAMVRIFNLVDRIEQLYSGDLLGQSLVDEESDEAVDIDAACQGQANMDFLVPLLSSIINTSLLPIIDDLAQVTNYPGFSVTYRRGFLDLSFLGTETQGRIGFYVGAGPGDGVDTPGEFGIPEVHAMLGVLRVFTAGAQVIFSYNDLTQALLTFAPMMGINRDANPYTFARVLNTHPCESNPLLNPEFGVLTRQGNQSLALARAQLGALFAEQQEGLPMIMESQSANALLNYNGAGRQWADNLFNRMMVGSSTDRSQLRAAGRVLTENISPDNAAEVFSRMAQSLNGEAVFDPVAFVQEEEQAGLRDVLTLIRFEELGIPALRLNNLFDNPISDLKAVAPLTYTESEEFSTGRVDGMVDMLDQEKPPELRGRSVSFRDSNGDQHWNQRGDFIIQTERETFRDGNNDNTPSASAEFFGIQGTFWDLNGDGRPDPIYEDWQSEAVTTHTMPQRSIQNVMAVAATDSTGTYYFLAATETTGTHYTASTCLLGDVEDCEGFKVGQVLGHMWPSRVPEPYPAPEDFTGRTDPSNGFAGKIYLFFPNPSMNGVLVYSRADDSGKYRDVENNELNAFINSVFWSDLVTPLVSRRD